MGQGSLIQGPVTPRRVSWEQTTVKKQAGGPWGWGLFCWPAPCQPPEPSPNLSHQTRLSPSAGKVLPATLLLGNVEIYKQRHWFNSVHLAWVKSQGEEKKVGDGRGEREGGKEAREEGGKRGGREWGGEWGQEEERHLQDPQLRIQTSEGPWSSRQWRCPVSQWSLPSVVGAK